MTDVPEPTAPEPTRLEVPEQIPDDQPLVEVIDTPVGPGTPPPPPVVLGGEDDV